MIVSPPPHVVVDISSHGLGHVAQAAAVVNALADERRQRSSAIRLTVRSAAPEEALRERIRHPFDLIPRRLDRGMIMRDALSVDVGATMDYYRDFHLDYGRKKSDAARELEALAPDLVFSDVPYLSLDAAALVGVPSVALCSLNWADVFLSYCADLEDAGRIHDDILGAYSRADTFLRPDPSMPMDGISRTQPVPTLALVGDPQPERLRILAGLGDSNEGAIRFVLIGVGGVGIRNFDLERWPSIEGVYWIFPDSALAAPGAGNSARVRRDLLQQSLFDGNMRYIDLLASCSCIVTKDGYGTQTECVVNRVPSICIGRPDWPEHQYLHRWHERHGEVSFISWADIATRKFEKLVNDVLSKEGHWSKAQVIPTGATKAEQVLSGYLQ